MVKKDGDENVDLMEIIRQQQEQIKQLLDMKSGKSDTSRIMADLDARMSTFVFDEESNCTFSRWFDRFSDVFTIDGASLDEKAD